MFHGYVVGLFPPFHFQVTCTQRSPFFASIACAGVGRGLFPFGSFSSMRITFLQNLVPEARTPKIVRGIDNCSIGRQGELTYIRNHSYGHP